MRFEDSVGAAPVGQSITGAGKLAVTGTGGNASSFGINLVDDTTIDVSGSSAPANAFVADTINIGASGVSAKAGGNALALRQKTLGDHPDRDAQFGNIARLKQEYLAAGDPVVSVSMDTKKKELPGNFYRPGTLYAREVIRVFGHDFPSFADRVVIPHGLYDVGRNVGT